MKMFKKFSTAILIAVFAFVFVFGLAKPTAVFAVTFSPSLGVADSFAILAGTNITDAGGASVITGNVGLSPATGAGIGLLSTQVTGKIYAVDAAGPAGSIVNPGALITAKTDLETAYDNLAAGGNATCGNDPDHTVLTGDGSGGATPGIDWTGEGVIDLAGRNLVPGVYCASSFSLAAAPTLTLSGGVGSVYIFRSAATIITSPGSSVTGGDACNMWWRAVSSVTLDTTTAFKGNILALQSITMNTGATLTGRALARNAAVTLQSNAITNATCSGAGGALYGTLHVVKNVENDDDGDATSANFNLHVKLSGTDVAGSPATGNASPGNSYSLAAGTYVISEDEYDDYPYTRSFSGDCDADGGVTLANGDDKTCTVTNTDDTDNNNHHHKHKSDKKETAAVATPGFPAAGAPQGDLPAGRQENTLWNSIIFSGILILVSTSLVIVKRKRTI